MTGMIQPLCVSRTRALRNDLMMIIILQCQYS